MRYLLDKILNINNNSTTLNTLSFTEIVGGTGRSYHVTDVEVTLVPGSSVLAVIFSVDFIEGGSGDFEDEDEVLDEAIE